MMRDIDRIAQEIADIPGLDALAAEDRVRAIRDVVERSWHSRRHDHARDCPVIRVDQEVLDGYSTGMSVADLDIQFPDGSYTRFFFRASMKNGRPVGTVSTNRSKDSVSKSVSGVRRKHRE